MKPLSAIDLQQMLDDLEAEGFGAVGAAIASPKPSSFVKPASALGQMLSVPSLQDVTVLQDALSYLSSDVPRGTGTIISMNGAPVSDYWFGVILAVRREYGDAGKDAVREWSKQSQRYSDTGFEHAWSQYQPNHPKPVTIGSVFSLAQANGWKHAGNMPSKALQGSNQFKLLDRAAIMAQPRLRWRVKGLLPEIGIGAIYGPSGSGKSFLGFDLGASIAAGADWFARRTNACPVTYVILESEASLRNRLEAWEVHNGKAIPVEFKAVVQPFQLAEPEQVEALGAVLPQGGVVIIDTLNRAAPGLDENSSQDMGRILAGMKRLQEITNGLVLVVHHTGKDASKGLRGHSSLHAALDGAIEVERSAAGRCWSAAKVKDGEDGKQVPFKLHVIDLGTDADGDPISSCAVGPDTEAIFKPKEPTGANQKAALKVIKGLLNTSTTCGQAGAGAQVACVRCDDAIAAAANAMAGVDKKRRPQRAREAVQGLISAGHLHRGLDEEQDEWLWL